MIQRRLNVRDVMTVFGCSAQTARARMRQMIHTEKPLTVSESDIQAWLDGKTVYQQKSDPTYNLNVVTVAIENQLAIPRRRV